MDSLWRARDTRRGERTVRVIRVNRADTWVQNIVTGRESIVYTKDFTRRYEPLLPAAEPEAVTKAA
jgi:hypothetical protein